MKVYKIKLFITTISFALLVLSHNLIEYQFYGKTIFAVIGGVLIIISIGKLCDTIDQKGKVIFKKSDVIDVVFYSFILISFVCLRWRMLFLEYFILLVASTWAIANTTKRRDK